MVSYGSHWYRAVVCMLLSGRIKARTDGEPNRTDVNRLCKEANFNQYLTERIATLLLHCKVVAVDRQEHYVKGPGLGAWWSHDVEKLQAMTREAFLGLVDKGTGSLTWRPTMVNGSHLIEYLQLFFCCFLDRALPEAPLERAMQEFSQLPAADLLSAAKACGVEVDKWGVSGWHNWLDTKGTKAIVIAMGTLEWLWYEERDKKPWLMLSPLGAGMLGLKQMPPPPELDDRLIVLPNSSILAGPGRDPDELATLFRCCKVKRIDRVYELQLDRKRLAEQPGGSSAGEGLRQILEKMGALPATVEDVLRTAPKLGGAVRIRWCSALVKPESAEVLDAIRKHPRLKGYLEAGAPPGYLLLKPRSSPENFVARCRELGFRVENL